MQTPGQPATAPAVVISREVFLAQLQAETAAIEAQQVAGIAAARARIAAGESPFSVHRDKILGGHSTALRLQSIVLNLYNGGDWRKKVPVPLDNFIANADREHFEAAIDLMRGYFDRRENDRDFLALGRLLAEQRLSRGGRGRRA